MAQKLTAGLPTDYDIAANWIVRLTAVDPVAGGLVSGVNVSNVAIVGTSITPDTTDNPPSFVPVTPLWLPVPLAEQ